MNSDALILVVGSNRAFDSWKAKGWNGTGRLVQIGTVEHAYGRRPALGETMVVLHDADYDALRILRQNGWSLNQLTNRR